MGLLDHTRTYRFETSAAPSACVAAFADCLNGRGGALMGSEWRVRTDGGTNAVAVYKGRAGAIGVATAIGGGRARREEELAIGSELSFRAEAGTEGTVCSMAMTEVERVYFFFIADARFFRAAMNRVARRLAELDTAGVLTKV